MKHFDLYLAKLSKILNEEVNPVIWIKEFQNLIWNSKEDPEDLKEEKIWDILIELAYDLDFYEPNPEYRREDHSYYGDERLKKEIEEALEKLNKIDNPISNFSKEEHRIIKTALNKLISCKKSSVSINKLCQKWLYFVAQVERGYDFSVYDYANDLSVRDMLESLSMHLPSTLKKKLMDKLEPADQRFLKATIDIKKPIFDANDCNRPKWWNRIPRKLIGELKEDLTSEEII